MADFRQVTTSRSTIPTRNLLMPKSLAREVRRSESSVISEGIEFGTSIAYSSQFHAT
jgi:hypothetical protein